ncbi:hypothetical protein ABK905_05545 [Acerihabitans sp. KWT182]|uniref:Uncharacterized protein n=1 Tax=Acerihabitans sp. KWT182 TaxID=3157919 RepID=A0AAU7QDA1_9GAMM
MGEINHDNVNFCNANDSANTTGRSSEQLEWQLHESNAVGQVELPIKTLSECTLRLSEQLDELNKDLLSGLSSDECKGVKRLLDSAGNLLENGENAPLATQAGTGEHEVAQYLRQQLHVQPCAGFMERGRRLIDGIGNVLANDFTFSPGSASRRAGNVIAVATRTGTIVAMTTLLRQMLGFALEHGFQHLGKNAALPPRMVAGVASLLLGPGLNLAGAVRDERNGTATATSRISRIWMGMLSLGGLLIAAAYDPIVVIGHKLAAIGPQMAAYTLSRDLLQTLFPLHENGGTNVPGTVCSGFMYGIAQLLLAEGMTNYASQSGAEYLVAEAGRLAEPMADWATATAAMALIEPNHLHDLLRSLMNSAVEMFDELNRTALMRYFSLQGEGSTVQWEAETAAEKEPLTNTIPLTIIAAGAQSAVAESLPGQPIAPTPPRENDTHLRAVSFAAHDIATEGVRIGLDRPRIGAGAWPTSSELADNMLTTSAMRTSVFEAVVSIALTVSTALEKTRLEQADQRHIVSALIGGLVMVGYPAFVGAHLTGRAPVDAPARQGGADGDPVPTGAQKPELS